MGIIDFVKGHDDLMSEIRNTSDESVVVFRHPNEDFNNSSHLFLNESEVALFVKSNKDGTSEVHLMKEGGKLDTNNIPFLRSFQQLMRGGQTKYHCAIYFVRLHTLVANAWGTEKAVGPLEDYRHYTFKLVANGTYDLKIIDARALLGNVLGYGITSITKNDLTTRLNAKISNFISIMLSEIFEKPEMTASLARMQKSIRLVARDTFGRIMNEMYSEHWGVQFSDFTMNIEDVYENLADYHLKNNQMIQQTEAFDYQGAAYSTIQLYDMLKVVAANPSSMASSMMGMGFGAGVGGSIGTSIGSIIGSSIGGTQPVGTPVPGTGTTDRIWNDVSKHEAMKLEREQQLKELKDLHDKHLLPDEAYEREVEMVMRKTEI